MRNKFRKLEFGAKRSQSFVVHTKIAQKKWLKLYDCEIILACNTKLLERFVPNSNSLKIISYDLRILFRVFQRRSIPNLRKFWELERIRNLIKFRIMFETLFLGSTYPFFEFDSTLIISVRLKLLKEDWVSHTFWPRNWLIEFVFYVFWNCAIILRYYENFLV